MTYKQIEKAIIAANRSGEFRLVDMLETEAHFRRSSYREHLERQKEKTFDQSRRSFRG
jgi:hypothetical protein